MKKKAAKCFVPVLALSLLCQNLGTGLPVKAADTGDSKITIAAENISAKNASGHEAAKAVDGDSSTYWQSIPSNGEGDDYKRMYDHNRYIDITLDGTYSLSQIKIFNKVDNSFNNYYVYASADGVNYEKIISKTSNTAADAAGDSFSVATEASYLRLNMAYNSNSFATNLAEIEVYGTKISDTVVQPPEIQVEDWEGSSWQKEWDRFETDEAYAKEKTLKEMSNLVGRVVGEKWKESFRFEMRDTLKDGSDVFELKDGGDGVIVIRGNNGLAMASGFNYYLKNYVNVDYNPLYESNVDLKELKPVGKRVVKEAQFDIRYALNFCTYSYTMSFWNWDEYEEFLDWCAMNGINLVLDIVGQEEVLRQTLREYHYSDEEIKDYISGPAYFAWFYMQNLYSIGGPLPDAWFAQRVELGRQMHDRMQTYGISPVIQAFAGQVPEAFAQKNEGAVLTPKDGWSGFTRPSIIKTYLTEAEAAEGKVNYFADVANTFYEKQKNVFGDVSDYYAADPFHEGGATGGLDIANIFKTVQDEMLKSNPNAIWVIQHWQDNQKGTKMSKMDKSKTLSLDLQTDMNPQYGVFENQGSDWIYCMLHNFGGRMGLDGEVPVIAANPVETYNNTSHMKGIGMTMEAMENSPVVYELLFDTNWSKDPIDYEAWIEKYRQRRAGGDSESLEKAWDILLETAYADKGIYYQGAAETVINCRPGDSFNSASTWGHSNIRYDKAQLDKALLLLADNYEKFAASPAYKYDLADVAEQVLCNAAVEYHRLMVSAKNSKDTEKFKNLSTQFLNLIDLSDKILSVTDEFMLGTWIEAARKMIPGADDWTKDLMEFNARSLVTTWGGERVGSLKDYSNRKWAGLTSSFYKERWSIWVRNRIAELENKTKDAADAKAESNWFLWEYQWVNRKSDDENGKYSFSTTPSNADLYSLVMKAYTDFSYTKLEENTGSTTVERVNAAQGKKVTSSSATQSGTLSNITDGDTATEWVAVGEGPHTLEIDLEESCEIESVTISIPQLAKLFPYTWKLEYYDPAAGNWTDWKEYTGREMESNVNVVAASSIQASKLRLTMTTSDTANSPVTITEVAVYSKGSSEEIQYTNLAKGILPTTNKGNTASGYPLSNITNENTGDLWKTDDWGSSAYPAWVEVDLGSARDVKYAEVWFESAGRPFQFYVAAVGEDGTETTIFDEYKDHTGVLNQASYRIDIPESLGRVQKVKVYLNGITGQGQYGQSGPALSELKIMGVGEEGEEPVPEKNTFDRSDLLAKIVDAQELMAKMEKFGKTEGKEELQRLCVEVRSVYDTYTSTVEAQKEVLASLGGKMDEISPKVEEAALVVVKEELQDALTETSGQVTGTKGDYTVESWAQYQAALEKVTKLLANPTTSEELESARLELLEAAGALKKANKPQQPIDTPVKTEPEKPQPDKPETPKPQPSLPKNGEKYTVGKFVYKVTASSEAKKTVTLVKPVKKNNKKITVPSTVKIGDYSYQVTAVSAKAFRKNAKLTQVTIGKNVTQIGKQAFESCKKLKKVTIQSKVLKSVGKKAFAGMKAGGKIYVPKAKYKAYTKLLKKAKTAKSIVIKKK